MTRTTDPRTGAEPTGAAVILRVLRVSLHVGFAVLLLVALLRLLAGGITGQEWITLLLAVLLAAFYLVGTVLEKRHCRPRTRFDPRPYSAWWLGGVSLLWLLLVWASADFVWLAFPLFFLQLHVLRRRLALPAIALSTLLSLRRSGSTTAVLHLRDLASAMPASVGLQLPMVLGPCFRRSLRRGHRAGLPGAVPGGGKPAAGGRRAPPHPCRTRPDPAQCRHPGRAHPAGP